MIKNRHNFATTIGTLSSSSNKSAFTLGADKVIHVFFTKRKVNLSLYKDGVSAIGY